MYLKSFIIKGERCCNAIQIIASVPSVCAISSGRGNVHGVLKNI